MSYQLLIRIYLILGALPAYGRVAMLNFPSKEYSVETPTGGVQSLVASSDTVVALAFHEAMLMTIARRTGKPGFASLPEIKKQKLQDVDPDKDWHGLIALPKGYLLFDGRGLNTLFLDQQLNLVAKQSIIWDTLKPPRDRGGEAPTYELQKLRQAFSTRLTTTQGLRFAGFALKAMSEKSIELFVLTRIMHHPILEMTCSAKEAWRCWVTRACFVEMTSKVDYTGYMGLVYDAKQNELIAGHRGLHSLLSFKYQSCLHVIEKRRLALPRQIKELAGIHLNDADELWVMSRLPDDYLNASIFYWRGVDWRKHW